MLISHIRWRTLIEAEHDGIKLEWRALPRGIASPPPQSQCESAPLFPICASVHSWPPPGPTPLRTKDQCTAAVLHMTGMPFMDFCWCTYSNEWMTAHRSDYSSGGFIAWHCSKGCTVGWQNLWMVGVPDLFRGDFGFFSAAWDFHFSCGGDD